MDDLTLQEACLIELVRRASEGSGSTDAVALVEELREMRYRLEEVEGIEAEDFMIRPYSTRERQRLVAVAAG